MILSAIVARSRNNVIGKDNEIPWYLPADLKYFKRITLNHPIIMGRKTFDSIGRPLPKRTNIVLSRNPFFVASNVLVTNQLSDAISLAEQTGTDEAFIIGGGKIYEIAFPHLQRLYLTEVDTFVENGDAFFPTFDDQNWVEVSTEKHTTDDRNSLAYTFRILHRQTG